MPPGTLRSRSFTRLTMRVGLLHFGQSVLLVVSIIFLRSAVLAILAMVLVLLKGLCGLEFPGRKSEELYVPAAIISILHRRLYICLCRKAVDSKTKLGMPRPVRLLRNRRKP